MKRLALLSTLVVVAACADDGPTTAPPDPPAPASPQVAELTPFQQAVQSRMASRARDGLPTPEVSFDYTSDNGAPLRALQEFPGARGESFTIVATTVIRFDDPTQAGLERWPSTVVSGEVAADQGFVREGEYDAEVQRYVAERLPGFWQRHRFGFEPRVRRITETITVTYGDDPAPDLARATVQDELVHGLTFTGPNIDWTVGDEACVGDEIEVCAWKFRAGFAMDWGFGMRLPMSVSLNADDEVDEGTTFSPTSRAAGADWSAADYTAAGIAPESGNEFVMRYEFFLGAQVEVAEIPILDIGPDIDENRSSSFQTPFGPGAVFNLPTIDVPLVTRSLPAVDLEFGAAITPRAGSDRFRANWLASNGLLGNGGLTWTHPSIGQSLRDVFAVDGPATGSLLIDGSRYVFSRYEIGLGAYFEIDIIGLFTERYPIPITDFDLSNLIPDISVPIHPGASPTSLGVGVTVRNVAPTAAIDRAGARTLNGVDVFLADVDEAVAFRGTSLDPGLDDLRAEWDFGDGTPGTSTSYPLPGGATRGPNRVTDDQSHAFGRACVYPVSFTSTDSDGASNRDEAVVLVRSGAEARARLAGYWAQQLRGNGNLEFGEEELGCLLAIVEATSTVFHEDRDASSVPAALGVVDLSGNEGSEQEKLDRALLVAWLNFAAGAFDLDDPVDTDLDGIPDASFVDALASLEAVRLDPLATARDLQGAREVVHDISAQGT